MESSRSTLAVAAVVVVALVGIAVGVLVGRGGSDARSPARPSQAATTRTVNIHTLEAQLSDQLTAKLGLDTTVTCPTSVVAEAGGSFSCTGVEVVPGTTLQIDVSQVDNAGHVTWKIVSAS